MRNLYKVSNGLIPLWLSTFQSLAAGTVLVVEIQLPVSPVHYVRCSFLSFAFPEQRAFVSCKARVVDPKMHWKRRVKHGCPQWETLKKPFCFVRIGGKVKQFSDLKRTVLQCNSYLLISFKHFFNSSFQVD